MSEPASSFGSARDPARCGYSVAILVPVVAYLCATGGEDALAGVCCAGDLDPARLADTGLLLAREQLEAILAAARACLPGDDAFMEACAFSPAGIRRPLRFMRHAATPGLLYRAARRATWPMGPAGRFECVEHGRGFARIRYGSDHAESRLLCLWRQSRAIQAPTWWDLPPATLREGACIAHGDDACEYTLWWYGRPRWIVGGLGALAGTAVVLASQQAEDPLWWLAAPLGAAFGHLIEGRRSERANRERAPEFATAFRAAVATAWPRLAPVPRNGPTPAAPEPGEGASFRREADFWRITFAGTTVFLRDSRGLALLVHLLRSPGQDIHVATLDALTRSVAATADPPPATATGDTTLGLGDAGEVLDAQARAEYRRRLAELREELEDAESCNDPGRAAIAREEMEAIGDELRSALTPQGRERRVASNVERARVAVTRRIRAAIAQIARHHAALGDHLSRSVRTGNFCSYVPQDGPVSWHT